MIRISAPTKIILFGEHYVVYGAPALSIAVDLRREVKLEACEGESQVEILNPVYNEGGTIFPNGEFQGHEHVRMHAAIYKEIFSKKESLRNKKITAVFEGGRVFKGMGASSALGACMALGLYKLSGDNPQTEEIFRCAQIGDEIDHGGIPSGIDARTVVNGGMIKFWREFNPSKYNFSGAKIDLPNETTILIVDTFRGKRCSTGDQVKLFAKNNGLTKKPDELSMSERNKVISDYLPIYSSALEELKANGSARRLGEIMNVNHQKLKDKGMSTSTMDRAVNIILKNGGLGAKITGAGGEGGALIGLVWKKDIEKISAALKKEKFESLELKPTNFGVKLE
jgi:mevalonate kinase